MKTPSKLLLALTAFAAMSFGHSASANLITNGDFETGNFTGWTHSGDTNYSGVTDFVGSFAPHSGNYQAYFGPVNGVSGFLTQTLATTPGTTYTLSFWLGNFAATSDYFAVHWGGSTIFSLTDSSGFGYTEFTFNVTASLASTDLSFEFQHLPDYWFLDDISVNPSGVGVPDAGSTLPLRCFALLGLAAVRRKLSR